MHPFKQEYPKTYRGTRGRHITENIPYLRPCEGSSLTRSSSLYAYSLVSPSMGSFESIVSLYSFSSLSTVASSGFSFRKTSIRMETAIANPPVTAKFHTHESWFYSSTLHRLDAIMLPTFAFMAHKPIRTPFLLF
jgi:hypothetical protein